MKITIFLALALAAVYVAQAEPLYKKEAEGHTLEQERDQGSTQEPTQQGRQKLEVPCAIQRKLGLCQIERCRCFQK